MAEALVTRYGLEVAQRIAAMLNPVHAAFDGAAFVAEATPGYEALGLMARGSHLARVLRRHLPDDFEAAVDVLLASVRHANAGAAPAAVGAGDSLSSFVYLPYTCLVAEFGLAHFDASMRAQHALTQLFTAEFSIRPFLERHPEATLARLTQWARDPSEHVRRLVSEGTRPRLPWGRRLQAFQHDPAPVIGLLELLKDDVSLYVRRSVANNLNDIGKDHPDVLLATAHRWLQQPTPHRRWVVERALRSLVKAADPGALALLGFASTPQVRLTGVSIAPAAPRIGESVRWAFALHNTAAHRQEWLVDCGVHYVKANGSTSLKVFKLQRVAVAPGAQVVLAKKLSLAPMTTRLHHPGVHRVDVRINGEVLPLGSFDLLPSVE